MASAPQDLSEVYLLEKRKGEIEEVNIIPNGKRRCVAANRGDGGGHADVLGALRGDAEAMIDSRTR